MKMKIGGRVIPWALEKLHNVLFAYFWVTMLHGIRMEFF